MRRSLLGNCENCKYNATLVHCLQNKCRECTLYTEKTLQGTDRNGNKPSEKDKYTYCLCLCDATDEEVKTKTCKYKEET